MSFIINFIRFSRLHTVIGTSLSIVALYAIALAGSATNELHLELLALTLLSCLGANIYIVGLNQITDVEIDKINKPYLPLASGAFSMRQGYFIVGLSLLVSLAIAIYLGEYLLLTVLLSLVLGTAYSLPPVRLKRFPFWAAFCIIAVRGLIVNLLLFLHFNSLINGEHQLTPVVLTLTLTIFVYSIIIAWFKDIPDMEGDRRYDISTFSIRFGAKRIFLLGNGLISLTFLALIIFALLRPTLLHAPVIIATHVLFFLVLVYLSRKVQVNQPASMSRYYQFIWVLFFGEYILFAVAKWI